ncbi:hypothetical protein L9F63_015183, partial [Diploptera punctata]
KVEFKLLSVRTLYSLLVQSIMVTITFLTMQERIYKIANVTMEFGDLVLEVGCSVCISFAFLVPITHLPESPKKAHFFSNWIHLQNKFERVTGKQLVINLQKVALRRLLVSFVIGLIYTGLLFALQIGYKWWQGIVFFYNGFMSFLMADFWVLTTKALIIVQENLEASLTQVLIKALIY